MTVERPSASPAVASGLDPEPRQQPTEMPGSSEPGPAHRPGAIRRAPLAVLLAVMFERVMRRKS